MYTKVQCLNYHRVTAFPYQSEHIFGQRLKNTKSSSLHKPQKVRPRYSNPSSLTERIIERPLKKILGHIHPIHISPYRFSSQPVCCSLRKRREQSRYQISHDSWNLRSLERTWTRSAWARCRCSLFFFVLTYCVENAEGVCIYIPR